MIAAACTLIAGVVIIAAIFALAAKSREQDAAVAALLDAEWDAWAEPLRSDTPIHDRLAVETFRAQLDDGRTA